MQTGLFRPSKILESDVRIDLLITDVRLPGGMNGRRPDLKVLFITGYAENAVLGKRHLEPGMSVKTKPVEAMAARIRTLIERRRRFANQPTYFGRTEGSGYCAPVVPPPSRLLRGWFL